MYALAKKYWAPLLLLLVGVVVCVTNYQPGTFLSGWDTLHPEFNLPLAFQRAIFGVFRPEQGLGAVAGHSEMADIPHLLIITALSALNPLQTVRYFYIFLCFLIGPLGMYLFLRHIIPNKIVCFIGSLFYMLNIGTVQNFYVPFEMFTTQFALLPFLFFFATNFLFTKKYPSLVGFVITVIFFSPTAFASTLWYVSFGIFGSYLGTLSFFLYLKSNQGVARLRSPIKNSLLLLSLFLLLNLYWILPNFYFILLHGKEVTHALSNQLFSEEAFLYNKAFGNIKDILLLKTFYFDWSVYSQNNFIPLMSPWIKYGFSEIGYIFAFFAFVGILASAIKRKILLISFFPCIFLSLILLINDNFPFHIYGVFEKIPLFQEAFRFPDDKILEIFVFLYTIFLSIGLYNFSLLLQKLALNAKYQILNYTFYFLSSILILASSFPVFQGNLISPAMRINIPKNYFQTFKYINSQPQGRIATFPIYSPWGWEYYKWGGKTAFQGSGFMPFGLKDPTMDRDFDRWNSMNESYYKEMSFAVYSQNQVLFNAVLQKYNISYVLLDKSIIAPGYNPSVLFYKQLQALLQKDSLLTTPITIGSIYLYKTKNPTTLLSTASSLPQKPRTQAAFVDMPYLNTGSYQNNSLIADSIDNLDRSTMPFIIPANTTGQNDFSLLSSITQSTCPRSSQLPQNIQKNAIHTTSPFLQYISQNGTFCDHINVLLKNPYTPSLLTIKSRNLSGLPIHICIADPASGNCFIQTKLPKTNFFTQTTLLVPPMPSETYSINFANIGISPTTSTNDIANVYVTELPQQNPIQKAHSSLLTNIPYKSYANNSVYVVNAREIAPTATLVLSQTTDPGWKMYAIDSSIPSWLGVSFPFLFSQPIGTHIIVNSWENGWDLSNSQFSSLNDQLIIIFLPQYLEYFGFIIVVITIVGILLRRI